MATNKKTRTALFERPVPADDVVIRCVRLGDALASRLTHFFSSYGLTILQYQVLRILYVRDPEGDGMPTGALGARLMVRGPDVTRLIDRLARAGLVERFRAANDRRVVRVRLLDKGTALVEEVHQPLIQNNVALFAGMPERELERLARLLARALDALA